MPNLYARRTNTAIRPSRRMQGPVEDIFRGLGVNVEEPIANVGLEVTDTALAKLVLGGVAIGAALMWINKQYFK